MTNDQYINRQEFDVVMYRRPPASAMVIITLYTLALVAAEIGMTILVFLITGSLFPFYGLFETVNLILVTLMGAFVVIWLGGIFLVQREWQNTIYAIQSGKYRKIDNFVDQKPGHISVKTGSIFVVSNHYPGNLFKKAELSAGILGKWLGYGTIFLQGHKSKDSVALRFVGSPQDFVFKAQLIIDSANSNDNQLN